MSAHGNLVYGAQQQPWQQNVAVSSPTSGPVQFYNNAAGQKEEEERRASAGQEDRRAEGYSQYHPQQEKATQTSSGSPPSTMMGQSILQQQHQQQNGGGMVVVGTKDMSADRFSSYSRGKFVLSPRHWAQIQTVKTDAGRTYEQLIYAREPTPGGAYQQVFLSGFPLSTIEPMLKSLAAMTGRNPDKVMAAF